MLWTQCAVKVVKENQSYILKTQDENKRLREERDKLQRLLQLTEQSSVEIKEDTAGFSKLSVAEVERLRAVFNVFFIRFFLFSVRRRNCAHFFRNAMQMFDHNNEGRISLSGIQQLHEKLGEPLTDDEATGVVRTLDRDGTGVITFEKVWVDWWIFARLRMDE